MGDTAGGMPPLGSPGTFVLVSCTRDDGSEVILRKATGPQYVVADWPAEHACAAAAALAAALAEAGAAPLEGCVEDVQGMPSGDEYYVASRRVHASPESFTHPSGSAAASLQELLTDDGGTVGPAAVLLTHVFALLRKGVGVLPADSPFQTSFFAGTPTKNSLARRPAKNGAPLPREGPTREGPTARR